MLGRVLFALLLVSPALAGCIEAPDVEPAGSAGSTDALDLKPLWDNAQTAAHPAYGFPTFTSPYAEGASEWWTPIPERALPTEIVGLEHLAGSGEQATSGAGIALFGSLAIVPSWSGETAIFDIRDPTAPVKLSTLEDQARDADTIAYPDGRLIAVFATDNGIIPIWDITDPENPDRLGQIEPPTGSHNVAVVPGTPILYNANSAGGGSRTAEGAKGQTEIYDLSDPENPRLVQEWKNGFGCHDITFYVDAEADKHRGYCAGIEMTQIWDLADPENPEVLVNVPVHHGNPDAPSATVPLVLFSHLAMVNDDATVLVVGDETGGGAAPACDVGVDGPGADASGPLGNLWFYDITDERNPKLLNWYSPTHHYPTNPPVNDDGVAQQGGFGAAGCTAHFGRIIPHAELDLLPMAFYGAGVVLIDFTNPEDLKIVDQWNENTNTWDVWYYNGYLFTGDLGRGMDVLVLK